MKYMLRQLLITISMIGFIVIAAACGDKVGEGLNYKVDDFTFTNQEGQSFGMADLQGKVWITDFVFVNCSTVCPPMTSNMVMLQNEMKKANVDAEIVSFSVDPENDTPDVLKLYGTDYNVDFSNWNFLTGYEQTEIRKFAENSFKTVVVRERNSDQVIHGIDFYLVDGSGTVYQKYNGVYDFDVDEIIADMKRLLKAGRSNGDNNAVGESGGEGQVEVSGGELLYRQSCLSCHGADLSGRSGPNLQKVGSTYSEAEIKDIIQNGKGRMPSFKSRLTDEQLDELTQWLATKI